MKTDIYSFLLRGLFTDLALDSTGRTKLSNSNALEIDTIKKLPYTQLDQRYLITAKKMATVFVAITAFENTMRDFISKVMSDNATDDWWNLKAPEKLKKKVEGRIANEKKVPWHAARGGAPIHYTDFGDLSDLIISQWEYFEQDVQDQSRIKSAFNIMELSRNACMHGGDISDRDIERVGMLMRDWLEQLGLG